MSASEKNLRDELFPNGAPSPEEFIRVLAAYVAGQLERERSQGADLPVEISEA